MSNKKKEKVWHKKEANVQSAKVLKTTKKHRISNDVDSNVDFNTARLKSFVNNFDNAIRQANKE
jgi:hypothetical protein